MALIEPDVPDTCNHQTLDLDCPVCRLFMDDPDEDWGLFEAGPDTGTP